MVLMNGVNLLPATGEWAYDTQAHRGAHIGESTFKPLNLNAAPAAMRTDYSIAIDQLQAQYPGCTTVALIVAWFGNSTDVGACQIYPSTTFIGGAFQAFAGGTWAADSWRCSSLTQLSPGLIPISMTGGSATYGGTPADPAVVRCIQDLKARGLRVVFYPFILMDCVGFPWRGRITYAGADKTSAASTAVSTFLGSASTSNFTRDTTNLTVAYSGAASDYTFRRMILHYANLCVVAGGVDLFLLGSEFRGIETVRGPAWTKAGTTGADGKVSWDYPFVQGLIQLSDDVRSIFDGASLTKDVAGLHNLVAYSADWSDWMGFQHPGENGQWPHLDQLFGHANIDLVSFDNYLPLSDWTTGGGGLDALNWDQPAPTAWPPTSATMNGLGLSGPATIASKAYFKANIEGGEKFNWFYNDGTNDGRGADPNGTDLQVSRPEGDRLSQTRSAYYPNQQILANKQLRWWWSNTHQAVYDAGDGLGYAPHGPVTAWVAQSKPITFAEYGVPSCDRGTNQPNLFFDAKSSESGTPYWSIWDPVSGGGYAPRRDNLVALLALEATYEYWVTDGNNLTSSAGVKMIEPTFMSVWNWDARPFPVFPQLGSVWGDAGNWPSGQWLNGKGPFVPPPAPDAPPVVGTFAIFPTLSAGAWSTTFHPRCETLIAAHVSGRESRAAKMSLPLWDIDLSYDLLRMDPPYPDLQAILGFYAACIGQDQPFLFMPPALSFLTGQAIGIGDGATLTFALTRTIGAYAEPVVAVSLLNAVYANGSLVAPADYMLGAGRPATLVFVTPPAAGVVLTADFGFYQICRFAEDQQDLEEFAARLFSTQALKLRTVKI